MILPGTDARLMDLHFPRISHLPFEKHSYNISQTLIFQNHPNQLKIKHHSCSRDVLRRLF